MASSRIAEAYVQIVPTMGGASAAISNEMALAGSASSSAFSGKFAAGLGSLAAAAGAAMAVNKIFDYAGEAISAAEAVAVADSRIKNISQSMGIFGANSEAVSQRLIDYAAANERSFATDAEVIKAAQAKLLTFKELAVSADDAGGAFDRATQATMDMAAAGFGSAETNAVQLGKALNDPIKGITALSRSGITFTAEQKEMIKTLVESGQMFEAQNMILKAVETQVGGTAAATATSSEQMKLAFDNISEAVGAVLLPIFNGFADAVMPITDWLTNTPGAIDALVIVVGTFAAILGVLAIALAVYTIAQWAANIAMLANPITWIILAIVAAVGILVAIIVLIVQNWEAVVQWLSDVFGPIFEWLGGIFTWLWESIIKPVVDFIGAIFTWLWETIIKPIVDFIVISIMIWAAIITWLWENVISPVFDFIGAIFEWIWNTIIQPIIDYIVDYIDMLGIVFEWLYENVIKPVFDNIAAVFTWIWENIIQPVFNWISDAVNAVGKVFSDVFGAVGSFIEDTFKNIVNFIKIPINAVVGFINMIIDGINSIRIDVPQWINDLLGTNVKSISFNIKKLPQLAAGGFVNQPTAAIIGEAGPEVVTPLKDFERMMGIGSAAGSGNTVNYYAAPNQSLDNEQELFDAMRRAKVVAGW